ncbi:hypothetical protein [Rhizobium sp. RU36D]|uniref:hypothetical protein n=1 Tax=Rhizobium sp. RU36D TaxID=1907415 RepID=UPI001FCDF2FC|nr:hypothetical protein [Rhizobium sp. RU36D]
MSVFLPDCRNFDIGNKTVAKFGFLTDIPRMFKIADLLLISEAYGRACGVEEKTVSGRVFGDSKKLAALRGGADLTTARFNDAIRWFSLNWPENATWPEGGIDRPSSNQHEAAA